MSSTVSSRPLHPASPASVLRSPRGSGLSMGGHERGTRGLTDDWLTPLNIVQAVGPFDLDPAASLADPYRCAPRAFTVEDDGLNQDWGNAFVWLNPPYGPEAAQWLAKLAKHGRGIALIFARTETSSFFSNVWEEATSLFFLRGRLRFVRPDGSIPKANAGAPSVLVGYGGKAMWHLMKCKLDGQFIGPWS